MACSPAKAHFRFYAELNDHLPLHEQYCLIEKQFFVSASVKDMIESSGVPHTEVDLVLVNGESTVFTRLVNNGDRVAVYFVFESMDITPVLRLRPQPPRVPKFVLDVHLGKLAGYLRMLGFDAIYSNTFTDQELVRLSSEQKRVLLTRDRGVLKHSAVTHGYWLRETNSRRQAVEVIRRFDLVRKIQPFARCMTCNHTLERSSKNDVCGRISERVFERCDRFQLCRACGRVYWEGTHFEKMSSWIKQLIAHEPNSQQEDTISSSES
jgi:uncharacterized protein with PIN domain